MQTKHVKIGLCESGRWVQQTAAFSLSATSPAFTFNSLPQILRYSGG
jgi:hypothetical protein